MATVEASHLQSTLWESVTQHELVVNERVRQCRIQGEPTDANIYEEWDAYLSKLGAGEEGIGVTSCDDTQHDAAKLIKLPSDIVFQGQDLDAFIDEFYPDIVANYTNVDWLKARTILAPKNDDVEEINTKVLRKLPGAEMSFLSADDTIDDSSGLWSTDILNTWNANGMPPHELKLKEGCIVMLLRNLHATRGLCNGTRLRVEMIKKKTLICTIVSGHLKRMGQRVLIYRIPLQSTKSEFPCTLRRLQFPVRLAFAMTIVRQQDSNLALPKHAYTSLHLHLLLMPHAYIAEQITRPNAEERRPLPPATCVWPRTTLRGALARRRPALHQGVGDGHTRARAR